MRPDISEFSYGYALTEQLVTRLGPLAAAPRFPSLIEEGSIGYDLKLDWPALGSLFLQFKMSDRLIRNSALEIRALGLFPRGTEFFRIHLRPRKTSMQHDLLCDLADKGERVYYAAPEFDTPAGLNTAYLTRRVPDQSAFFSAAAIGRYPDDGPHHISFQTGGTFGWRCSEPMKVSRSKSTVEALFASRQTKAQARSLREELERLVRVMSDILERRAINAEGLTGWAQAKTGDNAERSDIIAPYMARAFFNSELILVGSKQRK